MTRVELVFRDQPGWSFKKRSRGMSPFFEERTMDFYLVFTLALTCQAVFAAPRGTRPAQGQGNILCSPCPTGYGVIRHCSQLEDTICAPCKKGFHSDKLSTLEPCHPCSLCGENLYELHSCNATNDVFCETCVWPVDSQHNADFLRKCVHNGVSVNENKYKKNLFGVYEKSIQLYNDAPAEESGSQGDKNEADPDNDNMLAHTGDKGHEKKIDKPLVEKGDIEEEGSGEVDEEQGVAHPPINQVMMGKQPVEQLNPDQGELFSVGDGSGEDGDIYKQIEEFTVKVEVPKVSSTKSSVRGEFPLKGGVPVYTKAVTPVKTSTVASIETPDASDPPVDVFVEAAATGEQKDPEAGASKSGSVGAFPILMAILTAGVVFFAIGFFYHRFKGNNTKQVYTPQQMKMKPMYKQTPTEPPADEDDYKPPVKRVPTPEIIYTTHDEPDVQHTVPDVVLPPPPNTTNKPDVRKPMPPIGKYQSPVDIDPEEAELSDELEKSRLVFKYVPENTKSLTNIGDTVKVMVDCRGSDLHGGPLGEKRYCLDHFRFHWGADDTRGSEHSVAGKRYAGEIQLVHWNKEDFRTFAEASRYESGLSIISIFMEVSGDQHTNLQTLLDVFKSIQYKGGSVEVPHHYFDPAVLLPGNTLEYWTYPGSLTESPYHETVTWLVMKEPIKVSSSQMATFRTLMRTERDEGHGAAGEKLVDNFREQSALGDRSLRASFR